MCDNRCEVLPSLESVLSSRYVPEPLYLSQMSFFNFIGNREMAQLYDAFALAPRCELPATKVIRVLDTIVATHVRQDEPLGSTQVTDLICSVSAAASNRPVRLTDDSSDTTSRTEVHESDNDLLCGHGPLMTISPHHARDIRLWVYSIALSRSCALHGTSASAEARRIMSKWRPSLAPHPWAATGLDPAALAASCTMGGDRIHSALGGEVLLTAAHHDWDGDLVVLWSDICSNISRDHSLRAIRGKHQVWYQLAVPVDGEELSQNGRVNSAEGQRDPGALGNGARPQHQCNCTSGAAAPVPVAAESFDPLRNMEGIPLCDEQNEFMGSLPSGAVQHMLVLPSVDVVVDESRVGVAGAGDLVKDIVVTSSRDGHVRIWDCLSGICFGSIYHSGGAASVIGLFATANDRYLLIAISSGKVVVARMPNRALLQSRLQARDGKNSNRGDRSCAHPGSCGEACDVAAEAALRHRKAVQEEVADMRVKYGDRAQYFQTLSSQHGRRGSGLHALKNGTTTAVKRIHSAHEEGLQSDSFPVGKPTSYVEFSAESQTLQDYIIGVFSLCRPPPHSTGASAVVAPKVPRAFSSRPCKGGATVSYQPGDSANLPRSIHGRDVQPPRGSSRRGRTPLSLTASEREFTASSAPGDASASMGKDVLPDWVTSLTPPLSSPLGSSVGSLTHDRDHDRGLLSEASSCRPAPRSAKRAGRSRSKSLAAVVRSVSPGVYMSAFTFSPKLACGAYGTAEGFVGVFSLAALLASRKGYRGGSGCMGGGGSRAGGEECAGNRWTRESDHPVALLFYRKIHSDSVIGLTLSPQHRVLISVDHRGDVYSTALTIPVSRPAVSEREAGPKGRGGDDGRLPPGGALGSTRDSGGAKGRDTSLAISATPRHIITANRQVFSYVADPDDSGHFLTTHADGRLRLWSIDCDCPRHTFDPEATGIVSVTFLPCQRQIAVLTRGKLLKAFNMDDYSLVCTTNISNVVAHLLDGAGDPLSPAKRSALIVYASAKRSTNCGNFDGCITWHPRLAQVVCAFKGPIQFELCGSQGLDSSPSGDMQLVRPDVAAGGPPIVKALDESICENPCRGTSLLALQPTSPSLLPLLTTSVEVERHGGPVLDLVFHRRTMFLCTIDAKSLITWDALTGERHNGVDAFSQAQQLRATPDSMVLGAELAPTRQSLMCCAWDTSNEIRLTTGTEGGELMVWDLTVCRPLTVEPMSPYGTDEVGADSTAVTFLGTRDNLQLACDAHSCWVWMTTGASMGVSGVFEKKCVGYALLPASANASISHACLLQSDMLCLATTDSCLYFYTLHPSEQDAKRTSQGRQVGTGPASCVRGTAARCAAERGGKSGSVPLSTAHDRERPAPAGRYPPARHMPLRSSAHNASAASAPAVNRSCWWSRTGREGDAQEIPSLKLLSVDMLLVPHRTTRYERPSRCRGSRNQLKVGSFASGSMFDALATSGTASVSYPNDDAGDPEKVEIGSIVALFFINQRRQRLLLVVIDVGVVVAYDTLSMRVVRRIRLLQRFSDTRVMAAAVSPDERIFFYGDSEGRVVVYTIEELVVQPGAYISTSAPPRPNSTAPLSPKVSSVSEPVKSRIAAVGLSYTVRDFNASRNHSSHNAQSRATESLLNRSTREPATGSQPFTNILQLLTAFPATSGAGEPLILSGEAHEMTELLHDFPLQIAPRPTSGPLAVTPANPLSMNPPTCSGRSALGVNHGSSLSLLHPEDDAGVADCNSTVGLADHLFETMDAERVALELSHERAYSPPAVTALKVIYRRGSPSCLIAVGAADGRVWLFEGNFGVGVDLNCTVPLMQDVQRCASSLSGTPQLNSTSRSHGANDPRSLTASLLEKSETGLLPLCEDPVPSVSVWLVGALGADRWCLGNRATYRGQAPLISRLSEVASAKRPFRSSQKFLSNVLYSVKCSYRAVAKGMSPQTDSLEDASAGDCSTTRASAIKSAGLTALEIQQPPSVSHIAAQPQGARLAEPAVPSSERSGAPRCGSALRVAKDRLALRAYQGRARPSTVGHAPSSGRRRSSSCDSYTLGTTAMGMASRLCGAVKAAQVIAAGCAASLNKCDISSSYASPNNEGTSNSGLIENVEICSNNQGLEFETGKPLRERFAMGAEGLGEPGWRDTDCGRAAEPAVSGSTTLMMASPPMGVEDVLPIAAGANVSNSDCQWRPWDTRRPNSLYSFTEDGRGYRKAPHRPATAAAHPSEARSATCAMLGDSLNATRRTDSQTPATVVSGGGGIKSRTPVIHLSSGRPESAPATGVEPHAATSPSRLMGLFQEHKSLSSKFSRQRPASIQERIEEHRKIRAMREEEQMKLKARKLCTPQALPPSNVCSILR